MAQMLNLADTFNADLPSDPVLENAPRVVEKACYSFVQTHPPTAPQLIHAAEEVSSLVGIGKDTLQSPEFLDLFSGKNIQSNMKPYAMAYGGHQFGHWAGQLGDGRAINLGEVVHNKKRWALQLKGAGPTPYSRSADGFAVLRSSIREHLCSEAMFHLGVPTTRSLSLVLSGDNILRDMLYNGNAEYEKGAIVCRVAPSFVRFGNFQLFTSRGDFDTLEKLTQYTIKHFFPGIPHDSKTGYTQFFEAVVQKTIDMIVHWQRVGFVHGVMNTDNMSILGLTIDYGPYGWLEDYNPHWTPNTTDRQNKRYRFSHQPSIALWNLYQLGNALFPLVKDAAPFESALNNFKKQFAKQYMGMMRSKLGLVLTEKEDAVLIDGLKSVLNVHETDMTIFFRKLSAIKRDDTPSEGYTKIEKAFYNADARSDLVKIQWLNWFEAYLARLKKESLSDSERQVKMNRINPKYVLRNYMAQLAIDEANKGEYNMVSELHEMLKQPYHEQPENEKWFAKRPEWARHKVGCSMLSCSS